MATSPSASNVGMPDHPNERPDPGDELDTVSNTTPSGKGQDATDTYVPSPVIQSAEDSDNQSTGQNPSESPSETNTGPLPDHSLASDKARANDQLLDAALEGDLEGLRTAIEAQANPIAKGLYSETALHKACRYGHVSIVEELLKHESFMQCLRAQDNDGWTPLFSACYANGLGSKRIVELLLECHADFDIEARSKRKRTVLHLASVRSSTEIVQLLLDKKAKVNVQDYHNSTPLTLACQWRSTEVVQSLLKAGADCKATDNDGDTPFILASRYGDSTMVRAILAHDSDLKSISRKNESHKDALGRAVHNLKARDEIIPLLLNRGLRLDDEDASIMFCASDPARKVSGASVQDSAWSRTVQKMLSLHSPTDVPLQKAIGPILKFASKEEKVSALINADSFPHFEILSDLTKNLRLSKDVCTLVWLLNQKDYIQLAFKIHLEWSVLKMLISWPISDRCMPDTPLQWSAYYGDYTLVWCLLRQSQSENKEDVKKALDIAKARKPTRRIKEKKDIDLAEDGRKNDTNAKDTHRGGDSKEPDADEDSTRYERTIDILDNATRLVTIPKKQLPRPNRSDIEEKEPVLQKMSATVISLYEREGQIDLLRSSPSVFDLVYGNEGDSVNHVLEMARSTFDGMTSTTLKRHMPKQELQMRWIHLPANNMDWMEHLTLRIYDEKHGNDGKVQDDEKPRVDQRSIENEALTSFMDLAQRSQNELPTDKSTIKFMKPICLRELDGALAQNKSQATTEATQPEYTATPRLALYMPYVTFGYRYAEASTAAKQKHAELLEKYEGRILHGPRSLDRFYYNAMLPSEMDERDKTQVVTRGLLKPKMENPPEEKPEKWPYLTVDQLWVWVIDNETIVTSSTHREDEFDNLLVNRIWENLLQASQDGFREKLPTKVTEMSQFLVSTCVDFVSNLTWEGVCGEDDKRISGDARLKPILSWYADSINDVAAQEKNLFGAFKNRTAEAEEESEKAVKAAVEAEAQNQDPAIQSAADNVNERISKLASPIQDRKDWEAIHNAAKLLDEVKDIRDELVILQCLVTQQDHVWTGLMGPDPDGHDARSPSFVVHELDAMIQMTDTIQKSIKNLLNLEENSIDIKESMMSRDLVNESTKQGEDLVSLAVNSKHQNDNLLALAKLAQTQSDHLVGLVAKANKQSEDSAKQEKILFVFTIVTVIFTPLSFMTSILALNTTTSRHNDDGELEWEPALMYGIIFGTSAGFFVLVLLYTFFGDTLRAKLHEMRHGKSQSTGNVTNAPGGGSSKSRCTRDIETGHTEPSNTQQTSLAARSRRPWPKRS